MRVLWFSYAPLGRAAEIIEGAGAQSGTWIDAMKNNLRDISLGIACIASKDIRIADDDGTVYYGVSGIKRYSEAGYSDDEKEKWHRVIEDFRPDIIMIWGTEYGNGNAIMAAADDIPVLFYIQGVLGRIVKYPMGMIEAKEIKKELSVFSRVKWSHYKHVNADQAVQANAEIEMVSRSSGVITDNEWADSYYRRGLPADKIFHVPLPVNPVFLSDKHRLDNCEKHSVFSIACNNPAKGIHILIKALAIVKGRYPDVKLYLPGNIDSRKPEILYKSPYLEYLSAIIKKYGLSDNVVFCGCLKPAQMKERLLKCNVFAMPSCIENHSASLREAMYLGVPCVSSQVGSVQEFVDYGKNALAYRYEEYDVMADSIMRIFADDSLAKSLGDNAFKSIRLKYDQNTVGEQLINVYRGVLQ